MYDDDDAYQDDLNEYIELVFCEMFGRIPEYEADEEILEDLYRPVSSSREFMRSPIASLYSDRNNYFKEDIKQLASELKPQFISNS